MEEPCSGACDTHSARIHTRIDRVRENRSVRHAVDVPDVTKHGPLSFQQNHRFRKCVQTGSLLVTENKIRQKNPVWN